MASGNYQLEFERPLADLEARIAELDSQDDSTDGVVEKRRELRRGKKYIANFLHGKQFG